MQFVNQHSAMIVLALLVVAGTIVVWRRGQKLREWIILDTVVVALVAAWFVLRPVAPPVALTPGRPVLLAVQSPYCLGCVAMKPAVDRLEKEWRGRLVVQRVDIQSDEGKQLTARHGIEYTPTFVFFDAEGREQWRTLGTLDAARVRAALGEPE
jgi:thiol-disulfide isomerase/thioredoxin